MYDVRNTLYSMLLTEFAKKVTYPFVLNGAFCTISGAEVDKNTGKIVSSGFNYVKDDVVDPNQITTDSLVVDFIFYQKYEKKLIEDVHGQIRYVNDHYQLHIKNEVKILNFCPHTDMKLKLTKEAPLTVDGLREILGQVRVMYFLDVMDKLNDVINVPSTELDRDPILAKIKEYLKKAIDRGFIFDICVKSTTDVIDKKMLQLSLRKKDGSQASKDVVTIELFARKYDPAIIFNTYFENDKDPTKGVFMFLDSGVEPYLISKNINMEEADYFIKGIQRIASELATYTYVTDVTP